MINLNLGITGFNASLHKIDECEINGLPRLPYSVNIIGRFEQLKSLKHENLCRYLDAQRDKHERIVLATEYFSKTWESDLPDLSFMSLQNFTDNIYSIATGLNYLHKRGIIVRNLSLKNIFWSDNNNVKLSNYGLYNITDCGKEIDFPIGNYKYLSPEAVFDLLQSNNQLSCARSDVWSLGMIILEVLLGKKLTIPVEECIKIILQCLTLNENIFDKYSANIVYKNEFVEIAKSCLFSKVSDRIYLGSLIEKLEGIFPDIQDYRENKGLESQFISPFYQSPEEKYYFWSITGGNLWRLFRELCDLKDKLPPILSMPKLIKKCGDTFSIPESVETVKKAFIDEIFPISDDNDLMDKVSKLKPLLLSDLKLRIPNEYKPMDYGQIEFDRVTTKEELEMRRQPVFVKERDLKYQLRRVGIFQRLLKGLPLTYSLLLSESSYDIPPLLRSQIWPKLLRVDYDSAHVRYSKCKLGDLHDRASTQIAVDLPRCHSYDQLIVSSLGQAKLNRILRAWLVAQPQLEYTQGMDSLAAVFTRLMFGEEALAFACLEAFVDKYMAGLFCSSHGAALSEYCMILQQLLAFHQPKLSMSLNIFSITGFTASWIYTGFAHSLPLDKTVRLWDSVMLGESSFLMMVFIALLYQLDRESSFCEQPSEHIFSVLSNLPQFDLDSCCKLAIQLASRTPASLTRRTFSTNSSIPSNIMTNNDHTKFNNSSNISPIISFDDLLLLINEASTTSEPQLGPFAFNTKCLPPALLIDIRPKKNYDMGCLPGSLNFPINLDSVASDLVSLSAQHILDKAESSVKVIIGGGGGGGGGSVASQDNLNCDLSGPQMRLCQKVAKVFVKDYHCQYVCVLRGGLDVVRTQRPDLIIVVS